MPPVPVSEGLDGREAAASEGLAFMSCNNVIDGREAAASEGLCVAMWYR
jgi:hypothetical protein